MTPRGQPRPPTSSGALAVRAWTSDRGRKWLIAHETGAPLLRKDRASTCGARRGWEEGRWAVNDCTQQVLIVGLLCVAGSQRGALRRSPGVP